MGIKEEDLPKLIEHFGLSAQDFSELRTKLDEVTRILVKDSVTPNSISSEDRLMVFFLATGIGIVGGVHGLDWSAEHGAKLAVRVIDRIRRERLEGVPWEP